MKNQQYGHNGIKLITFFILGFDSGCCPLSEDQRVMALKDQKKCIDSDHALSGEVSEMGEKR